MVLVFLCKKVYNKSETGKNFLPCILQDKKKGGIVYETMEIRCVITAAAVPDFSACENTGTGSGGCTADL